MNTREPRARLPYLEPAHTRDPLSLNLPVKKVRFLHPGYPENSNILLQFSALDADNGIEYDTAHVACAIVANNRWDGFFSIDKAGQQHVSQYSLAGNILDRDDYYFQVPQLNAAREIVTDYPIVPTFAEWQFPHYHLPPRWSSLLGKPLDDDAAPSPGDRCCMTKSSLSIESAHLIPTNPSDLSWFDANVMGQYATINSSSNTIRLKVDVHQIFDRKPKFAIVPKYGKMVAHFFNADDAIEAIRLYHDVPLHPLNGKEIPFLLARVAWTVFPQLGLFLKARVRRKLVRLVNQQQVTQETGGDICDQVFKGARSRSASPRKRPASQLRGEEPEEAIDIDSKYEEERSPKSRGRKRRRSSCRHFVHSGGSCTSSGHELHRSGSEISDSTDAAILSHLME